MVSFPIPPPPSAGTSIFSFDVHVLGLAAASLGLRRRSCHLNVLRRCRNISFFFFFFITCENFCSLSGCSSPCKRRCSSVSDSVSFSPLREQNNLEKKTLEITHRSCGRATSNNNTRGFEERSYCLSYTCCFDRPQIHRPSSSRPPGSRLWAAAQIR